MSHLIHWNVVHFVVKSPYNLRPKVIFFKRFLSTLENTSFNNKGIVREKIILWTWMTETLIIEKLLKIKRKAIDNNSSYFWSTLVFTQHFHTYLTVKKAEHRRIDAFELWCWRRLLRVAWTARWSNQSILKISPGISLEGMMLKLKLQYFGHLMRRVDSLEKTLMLRGIGGRRRRGHRGWDGWMASPTQWTRVRVNSGSWWWTGRPGVLYFMGSQRVRHDWATELNWTSHILSHLIFTTQLYIRSYLCKSNVICRKWSKFVCFIIGTMFYSTKYLEWQVKQFAETSKWQSWDFKTCFMTPVHGMMLTKYVEVFILNNALLPNNKWWLLVAQVFGAFNYEKVDGQGVLDSA